MFIDISTNIPQPYINTLITLLEHNHIKYIYNPVNVRAYLEDSFQIIISNQLHNLDINIIKQSHEYTSISYCSKKIKDGKFNGISTDITIFDSCTLDVILLASKNLYNYIVTKIL